MAISATGGSAALAEFLDVTPQAFTGWRKAGRVPHGRGLASAKASNGRLTRADIRPDLYDEPKATGAHP